jgi:hypothetical protein
MSLETIAAHARAAAPGEESLPLLRLDADEDAGGLIAWFGADSGRAAAQVVIAGEDAGVIERADLYELVAGRTLGWGDSIGATLPGEPSWDPVELVCPVADCPQSPLWALSYDPAAPPVCAIHAGSALQRAT